MEFTQAHSGLTDEELLSYPKFPFTSVKKNLLSVPGMGRRCVVCHRSLLKNVTPDKRCQRKDSITCDTDPCDGVVSCGWPAGHPEAQAQQEKKWKAFKLVRSRYDSVHAAQKAKEKKARKEVQLKEEEEKTKLRNFRKDQREKVSSDLQRARQRRAVSMLASVSPLTEDAPSRMLSINEDIQTRQHYADLSQKDLMEFSEEDSIALHSSSPDSCLSPHLFDSQCSPNPQSPELGLSFSPPGQIFSSVDQSTSYPGLSSSDYPTSRWNPPPSPAMYQQTKYFRDDFVSQLLTTVEKQDCRAVRAELAQQKGQLVEHDVRMASCTSVVPLDENQMHRIASGKIQTVQLIRANIRRLCNWYTRAMERDLVLSYLGVRIEEGNAIQPTDRVNVQTPPTDRGEAGDPDNLDTDDEGAHQK